MQRRPFQLYQQTGCSLPQDIRNQVGHVHGTEKMSRGSCSDVEVSARKSICFNLDCVAEGHFLPVSSENTTTPDTEIFKCHTLLTAQNTGFSHKLQLY